MGIQVSCLDHIDSQHSSLISIHTYQRPKLQEPNRQYPLERPQTPDGIDDEIEIKVLEHILDQGMQKTATFGNSLKDSQQLNDESRIFHLLKQNDEVQLIHQVDLQFLSLDHQHSDRIKSKENAQEILREEIKQIVKHDKNRFIRSVSINDRVKHKQIGISPNQDDSTLKNNSETNTIKSILRNKGSQIKLNYYSQPKRTDDTISLKTSKKSSKKVSFDPKLLRHRNRNMFM